MKNESKLTWKDVVKEALAEIGTQGHIDDIYSKLREEKPLGEIDPKKNPNPGHEDVQGMQLELGKIYGCETSAAINDAKKKFMSISLEEESPL